LGLASASHGRTATVGSSESETSMPSSSGPVVSLDLPDASADKALCLKDRVMVAVLYYLVWLWINTKWRISLAK
jgi:hypothetical protein